VFLIGSAVTILAGCASPSETAIFVTKTSFSLVDVDTAPAGVSVAYDRVEGYAGPRYNNGEVFPVVSSFETRGRLFDREIRSIYATGEAANIVTTLDNSGKKAENARQEDKKPMCNQGKAMFFATGTVVGLKIGFVDGTPVPSSFALGYKRKEASLIPVEPGCEPAVLGTFDNSTGVESNSTSARFDVQQYFATGSAAVNLASDHSIKSRFKANAAQALGVGTVGPVSPDIRARQKELVGCVKDQNRVSAKQLAIIGKELGIASSDDPKADNAEIRGRIGGITPPELDHIESILRLTCV